MRGLTKAYLSSAEEVKGLNPACDATCWFCSWNLWGHRRRCDALSARSTLYSVMYSSHCFTASSYYTSQHHVPSASSALSAATSPLSIVKWGTGRDSDSWYSDKCYL